MAESFARRVCTDARLLKRSCESLLGICTGLLADGSLNDEEIRFLDLWLSENQELANTWPGEVVYTRIQNVLSDNIITEEEREQLKNTLSELIGGTFQQTGAAFGGSTSLPIDNVDSIKIEGNTFCFTGKFRYGTRAACERAITERNGIAISTVRTDLNYLIIGTMTSNDWVHTSHGRKIEKAIDYKQRNRSMFILSEKQWVEYL
jgi:NAD-dependent DNA ligase